MSALNWIRTSLRGGRFAAAALLMSGVVVAVTACHDSDKYVLSSDGGTPVSQLFTVTLEGDSTLPADGFSSVDIRARVQVTQGGPRLVTFTTTAGSLAVGNIGGGDTLTVPTDQDGLATARLIAPREPADARVLAAIVGVLPRLTQEVGVRFSTPRLDDVIRFIEPPDTARSGDNESVTLRVVVADGLTGDDRFVTFETTLGSFDFGEGDSNRSRRVRADEDGVAEVRLRGSADGGEALVRATVKGFTNETSIVFVAEPSVTFTEAPTLAPADGFTLTGFEVTIESVLQGAANRTVEFQTTAGTLVSGDQEGRRIDVIAGSDDVASVFIRSPREVVVAVVTATLQGVSDERAIRFAVAPPDSMILTIDQTKFRLPADDQIDITAFLIRDVGGVTEGINVSFTASDSLGGNIPGARFFNTTPTDSSGVARTVFTPDGTPFRGRVDITGTSTAGDTTVVGTTIIRIVDN